MAGGGGGAAGPCWGSVQLQVGALVTKHAGGRGHALLPLMLLMVLVCMHLMLLVMYAWMNLIVLLIFKSRFMI